jgi:hypothetical protein
MTAELSALCVFVVCTSLSFLPSCCLTHVAFPCRIPAAVPSVLCLHLHAEKHASMVGIQCLSASAKMASLPDVLLLCILLHHRVLPSAVSD